VDENWGAIWGALSAESAPKLHFRPANSLKVQWLVTVQSEKAYAPLMVLTLKASSTLICWLDVILCENPAGLYECADQELGLVSQSRPKLNLCFGGFSSTISLDFPVSSGECRFSSFPEIPVAAFIANVLRARTTMQRPVSRSTLGTARDGVRHL
jgi:hypothetical protein